MIRQDGMTLTYTDESGQTQSVSMIDWAAYSKVYSILQQQLAAGLENTKTHSDYVTALVTFQTNLDIGRAEGMTAPVVPKMKVVSDTGVVSFRDFSPALPLPVYPAAQPGGGVMWSPTAGNQAPAAPTAVEQAILSSLLAISGKFDALLKALGK